MKNYENSICFKVDRSLAFIQKGIKEERINVAVVSELLHEIRHDAQRMEEGLKRRKQSMERNKLEEEYQKNKGNLEYDTQSVNDTFIHEEYRLNEKADFEITIKDKGKTIYHNHDFAGIICSVQKVTDIEEDGTISGQCQKLYFGHDWSVWFAFDQLKQGYEDKIIRITYGIHRAVKEGMLKSLEKRQAIVRAMNNSIPEGR